MAAIPSVKLKNVLKVLLSTPMRHLNVAHTHTYFPKLYELLQLSLTLQDVCVCVCVREREIESETGCVFIIPNLAVQEKLKLTAFQQN